MSKSPKFLKVLRARCWEPLMLTFAGLFMVMAVADAAIVPFNNEIHGVFHTSDYKEVEAEGEATKIERAPLKNAENIEAYYREVNRQVEAEGLVLLKNDGALPLANGTKVTFALSGTGRLLYATHGPGVRRDGEAGGAYYDVKKALKEKTSLQVNDATYDFISTGAGKSRRGKSGTGEDAKFVVDEPSWSDYSSIVNQYDDSTVLAVITRDSGEGVDSTAFGSDGHDGTYLTLTQDELGILEGLAGLKSAGKVKKIVVLINSALNVQCDFIDDERYGIDAAMWIGLPGATGMRGVADVLVGDVNPSGKLSDTFVKDNFSAPSAMYWKLNGGFSSEFANATQLGLDSSQPYYGVYSEGIYVGYRYYETRYEDYVTNRSRTGNFHYNDVVAYPFGYGLSYSEFSYSNLAVAENKDTSGKTVSYDVSVTVKNDGPVAGKEAVQIYLQKPYNQHDIALGIEKAAVELVGFAKTDVLAPNATETVHVNVDFEQFRSYDSEADQTYILDSGKYYLTAAKNSHNAVNNILAAKGYGSLTDAPGNSALAYLALDQADVDSEVFSTSSAHYHDTPSTLASESCDYPITNRLDFMDPNRFKGVENLASTNGKVTYVSRNNWMGTLPSQKINLSLTDKAPIKYDISAHKPIVEAEGAQMPTFGDTAQAMTLAMMNGLAFDDPQWEIILNNLSQEEIFNTLVQCYGYTPEIATIAKPMTDEDDGPYGVSNTNQGFSSMSCEGIIAATFNHDLIAKVGEAIAADARCGIEDNTAAGPKQQKDLHGLYAPGLNIHRVIFGGRAAEYFSEDPYLSGIAAQKEIEAMQKQYVVACPKHFIFNDEETHRNGVGIWMNEQTAREIYLAPWEYALRSDKGNAHSLMTSFNRAGCLWTSASDDLMEEILRKEWGFDGYTLTDMAGSNGKYYMVYDDGFMNGTDCFLDKGAYKDMTDAMRKSPALNLKLRESMHRLLYTTANYSAAMNGYSTSTRLVKVVVPWKVALKFLYISSGVAAGLAALFFVGRQILKLRKED